MTVIYNQPLNVVSSFNEYLLTYQLNYTISPLQYLGHRCENMFFAPLSSNSELFSIIKLLKGKQGSLNTTRTYTYIYKICVEIVSSLICIVCIDYKCVGTFLECPKLTQVIPIFKSGPITHVDSYRPISTPSIL